MGEVRQKLRLKQEIDVKLDKNSFLVSSTEFNKLFDKALVCTYKELYPNTSLDRSKVDQINQLKRWSVDLNNYRIQFNLLKIHFCLSLKKSLTQREDNYKEVIKYVFFEDLKSIQEFQKSIYNKYESYEQFNNEFNDLFINDLNFSSSYIKNPNSFVRVIGQWFLNSIHDDYEDY